jgi:hypothetical protein
MNAQELIRLANLEVEDLANHGFKIEVEMSVVAGMVIIGMLQLACSHPQLTDSHRRIAKKLVAKIAFPLRHKPACMAIIDEGWREETWTKDEN